MTRKETDKIKLPSGYWWWNIADLGQDPNWQMKIKPPQVDVNDSRIFGYDRDSFMARQYKQR